MTAWRVCRTLPLLLVLSSGCAASNAVLNTAVAAAVAADRRAEGECFNPCTPGTRCNPETGLCDEIPCNGECTEDQYCDKSRVVPRCVYVGNAWMKIRRTDGEAELPSPHQPEGSTEPSKAESDSEE